MINWKKYPKKKILGTGDSIIVSRPDGTTINLDSPISINNSNSTFSGDIAVQGNLTMNNATMSHDKCDISTWQIAREKLAINNQETNPEAIFFKPDGTKMYIMGRSGDDVNEYALSTAWDVTTASFTDTLDGLELSPASEGNSYGIYISPDGIYFYLVGHSQDQIIQYTMSTAWDISTASYTREQDLTVSGGGDYTDPTGLNFKSDGTMFWVTSHNKDTVQQYTLSTAWDISTISVGHSFSLIDIITVNRAMGGTDALDTIDIGGADDIWVSEDGKKVWLAEATYDTIHQLDLSTAFNVTTATYGGAVGPRMSQYQGDAGGLYVNETVGKAFTVAPSGDTVRTYNIGGITFTNSSDASVGFKNGLNIRGDINVSRGFTAQGTANFGHQVNMYSTLNTYSTSNLSHSNGGTVNLVDGTTHSGVGMVDVLTNVYWGRNGSDQNPYTSGLIHNINLGRPQKGGIINLNIGRRQSGSTISDEHSGVVNIVSKAQTFTHDGYLTVGQKLQVTGNADLQVYDLGGTVIFSDTFTETNTTALESHTPDTGAGWTKTLDTGSTSTWNVIGGGGYARIGDDDSSDGVIYLCDTLPTVVDYEIKVDFLRRDSSDDVFHIIFKYKDANNFFFLQWSTSYSTYCVLRKKEGGSFSNITSFNYGVFNSTSDNTASALKVRFIDNKIMVWDIDSNGYQAYRGSYTVTDFTNDGNGGTFHKFGMGLGAIDGGGHDQTSTWKIDKFEVKQLSSAATLKASTKHYIENGLVGIGTTNPTKKLTVTTSAVNDGILGITTDGEEFFQAINANSTTFPVGVINLYYGSNANVKITALSNEMKLGDSQNNMTFFTASSERMRLTNTGQLGIGTNSPAYALDVASAGNTGVRITSAGTGPIQLRYENTGGHRGGIVVDNNGLYRIDATNIQLNSTANVGIGTASPSEKLHVVGDALITGDSHADAFKPAVSGNPIKFKNFGSTELARFTDGGNLLVNRTSDAGSRVQVDGEIRIYNANFDINSDGYGYRFGAGDCGIFHTGYNMTFKNYNGSSLVENMRLDSSGRLGIGTSNPSEKLHVSGNALVEGTLQVNSNGYGLKLQSSDGTDYIRMRADGSDAFIDAHGQNYLILDGASNGVKVLGQTSGVVRLILGSDAQQIRTMSGEIQFWTGSTERLKIDSSGNFYPDVDSACDLGHSSKYFANAYIDAITTTGNVIVGGDLTVSGTTVTVDTTNLNVQDKNITLNYSTGDSSSTADGAGITIQDAVNSSTDATILWDATNDEFDFSHGASFADDVKVAALKRLYFDGGGDTFVVENAPNNLQFKVGGNQKLVLGNSSSTIDSHLKFSDNYQLQLGTDADMQFFHTGGHLYMYNATGNMTFRNNANDADIIFQSDDGSGGVATYFFLDGSNGWTTFPDNKKATFGTGNDLQIYHDSSDSYLRVTNGDLYIKNEANDKDIIFQSDDGSGGVTDYITLDGGLGYTTAHKNIRFDDSQSLILGAGSDFLAYHNGTNTYLLNDTGNLEIQQRVDDGDIVFKCDDGSGGVTNYFVVDGSAGQTRFYKETRHTDGIKATFGNGDDLQLYHNGSNSQIDNTTGHLQIRNFADDKDIIFETDDGSGGSTAYFTLDGSTVENVFSKDVRVVDNEKLMIGSGQDTYVYHNGSNTYFDNYTGDLYFRQEAADKDIIFQCDDGSGSLATYMTIDGSAETTIFSKQTTFNNTVVLGSQLLKFADNGKAYFGDSNDLQLFHDGTDSYISNNTGHLYIRQQADDKDILLIADDGSGGNATYFMCDGGDGYNKALKNIRYMDSVRAEFGDSGDLDIYHTGSYSVIDNATGQFYIETGQDDGDILFRADDGSGGKAEYFRLDGGNVNVVASKNFQFLDNAKVKLGSSTDMELFHNGSNSFIDNYTGDMYIRQNADDKDLIFQCDDGSGGGITYFFLDGSSATGNNEYTVWPDDSVIALGAGKDMQLYHDGSKSWIYNNVGNLEIRNTTADADIIFSNDDGSGGETAYITLDGGDTNIKVSKPMQFGSGVRAYFGSSNHSEILHNGTDMSINNFGGDLKIINYTDDKDVILMSDDGSGGVTTYLQLDGSTTSVLINRPTIFYDTLTVPTDIIHSGDTDTKIRFTSDNIRLQAGGNNTLELAGANATFAGTITTTSTATGAITLNGGTGVATTGAFVLRQNGDGDGNGIAITSSHATSHRLWKDASGNFNIGSSSNSDAFKQDISGNVTIEGAITSTGTITADTYFQSSDTSAVLASQNNGSVFLRPNGIGSGTGAFSISSSGKATVSGELEATSLDINGNADISGTLNMGGTVTMVDGNVITGSNDVKIYARSTDTGASFIQFQNLSTGSSNSDGLTVGVNATTAYVWQRESASLLLGTNDTTAIEISDNQTATFSNEIIIGATNKIYLDGGSNTYISEDQADNIVLVRGGNTMLRVNSAGVTSSANVYSGNTSHFRNYGGVWKATTGLTGNGFEFINSVDGTAMTLSSTGDMSVTGNVSHAGLTPTAGTDIDQIKEFAMSFTLSADTWTDTGIDGTDLATGTYMMQVFVDDHNAGGGHYDEYYSATISWFSTATNSTAVDEIIIHRAGHAPNASHLQFRTQRAANTDSHDLMLQVKQNFAHSAALDGTDGKTMTFKFRRLI